MYFSSWYRGELPMSEKAVVPRIRFSASRPTPSVATMLGNEPVKGLLVTLANRGTLVPALAVLVVFYVFIQLLIGGGPRPPGPSPPPRPRCASSPLPPYLH